MNRKGRIFVIVLICITILGLHMSDTITAATKKKTKSTNPQFEPTYKVMEQVGTVSLNCKDKKNDIQAAYYIKGTLTNTEAKQWTSKAKKIKNKQSFQVKNSGNYSILVQNKSGGKTVKKINVQMELKGVWISYLDFTTAGVQSMSEKQFQTYVDDMYKRCHSLGLNTVMVQVRPFGDAMYQSKIFPWSYYSSGKQGKSPGYDPLKYMVEKAKKSGIRFYAWVNPYRVSTVGITNVNQLYKTNPARIWRNSNSAKLKRNVLTYSNQLYYNPAKDDVQKLIVDGVKEIVQNYHVDGIIFDDYFYPNLGNNYKANFDFSEYNSYKLSCSKSGKEPMTIVEWRRNNVNQLLKKVKAGIKAIDERVVFGVSPQGNLKNLSSNNSNYADVKTWMNSTDYIDFISPQIYWSFTNSVSPFGEVLDNWNDLRTKSLVNIYSSLAVYKAGMSKSEAKKLSPPDLEWSTSKTNLKRQVEYGRDTGYVDGFILYRYDNLFTEKTKSEIEGLKEIM